MQSISRRFEEVAPDASTYVVLEPNAALKYEPRGEVVHATTIKGAKGAVRSRLSPYDALIVHYMHPAWADLVTAASGQVRVVWSGYGGDYYGTFKSPNDGLLAPLTSAAASATRPRATMSGKILLALRQRCNERGVRASAAATSFFSAPIEEDLAVFTRRFPQFRGEYTQLNYATAEELSPASGSVTGESILVGNSATPANNHLDVFERLAWIGTEGRKVIVPLSYGDTADYRQAVLDAGAQRFGSDFEPLLELMPLADYNAVLASCAFVAMGHRRQQALGNVLTALLGGSTVLLDPVSPLYAHLTGRGIVVHSLAQGGKRASALRAASPEEQQRNSRLVHELWGEEAVTARVRDLLARLAAGCAS